jgi:hypothetical protein
VRALGSQEEDAPVVLGAEAGIDGEASENFFDCFTAFTKASSLSKGLLTPDFPFNAALTPDFPFNTAAFSGRGVPFGIAATAYGGTVLFFTATFDCFQQAYHKHQFSFSSRLCW